MILSAFFWSSFRISFVLFISVFDNMDTIVSLYLLIYKLLYQTFLAEYPKVCTKNIGSFIKIEISYFNMKDKPQNWVKKNIIWVVVIAVIVIILAMILFKGNSGSQNQILGSQSSSLTNPVSIDKSLETTLGITQLVTAEYTVLEVIRGETAWNKIKTANKFNDASEEGKEYILVKMRFHLIETSDGKGYQIPHTIFSVFSKDGVAYDYSSVIEPEPRLLSKELYSGATHEGWIAFKVSKEDTEPILRVSYPGVTEELWFKLYPATSINNEEQSTPQDAQQNDLLSKIQQKEEYPYFVPSLERECGLVFSDLNVEIVKNDANYSGTSSVSGKLTNNNPVPIFDVYITYGLYSEKGVLLTTDLIIEDEISSNQTISFSKEDADPEWSKPGIIYNVFAYRIRASGQEPDLDSQYCKSIVGYAKIN